MEDGSVKALIAMCLVLAAATSCRAQPPTAPTARHDIAWVTLEEAFATNKIVYVHFTDAPFCNPCTWQERSFGSQDVIAESDGEFACVIMCWCDETLHDQIKKMGCRSFPTDHFYFRDRTRRPLVFKGWKESWGPEQMLQRFRQAIMEDRK